MTADGRTGAVSRQAAARTRARLGQRAKESGDMVLVTSVLRGRRTALDYDAT